MQQDSSRPPAFSATATPISKLSEDTIHEVFSFITVTELRTTPTWDSRPPTIDQATLYLRPLHDLHRTSQVCNTWRRVILKASDLWGHVIDFDILSRCEEEWKEEVIKRASKSPIWVRGTLTNEQARVFLLFLAQNWERVEDFEIGWSRGESHPFTTETWSFLSQRAKRLRHFRLQAPMSAEIANIFAGGAPQLCFFSTQDVSYRLHPSWTSALRHLEIASVENSRHTVQELLLALKAAKHLERLVLVGVMPEDRPGGELDDIHLPHLRHITLYESIQVCNAILSHISACRGACVVVHASDFGDEDEEDIRVIRELGLQYFTAYLEVHAPSQLQIVDSEKSHFLSLASSPEEDAPDRFTFVISGSTPLPRSLVEGLVGLNSSSITSLKIEGDTSHILPSSKYFLQFLQSFDHVATLSTNISTLESLLVPALRSDSTRLLFPLLKTLSVRRSSSTLRPQTITMEGLRPVLSFLRQRSHSGNPIQTLDLFDLVENSLYVNKDALLSAIADLKVSWTKPSTISV